ncbi:hypothetical protein SASPL_104484 [Salvia splendens]|uniref:Uncharacterized protein n=1 Tax=Salvia splendens TaxID=180675 RepID=A0A8X8YK05_SALSN|nr:hypothetical protein SASPL_104484 [Salvia splendens]
MDCMSFTHLNKIHIYSVLIAGDVIKGKEDESNCISSKEMNSIFQERPGPSPLSSSLYYGAKEDMYVNSSGPHASGPKTDYKKDGGVNDPSGNNSTGASRGNWWQGIIVGMLSSIHNAPSN